MLRDIYKNETFFNDSIEEIQYIILDILNPEELKKAAQISLKYKCDEIEDACALSLREIHNMYAVGSELKKIKCKFKAYLEVLTKAETCYESLRGSSIDNSKLSVTPNIFSTIVYAECLSFDRLVLEQLVKYIPSGKDQLVDRLLCHYQPERKINEELKEKGKYKQLIEILDSSDKAFQAKKLKTYLDQWPKKLGIRAPDGIRPLHETPTYDGYWCYEAAAVVIVADIDDESFKDHEFYPAELMSWRK